MTRIQIDQLASQLPGSVTVIETHISWVILGPERVYKIRKPIRYAFLDFSSLDLRKQDCEKELLLNRRTSPQVYIRVVTLREDLGKIWIGEGQGKVIDHAVEMVRLDNDLQMDVLLRKDLVGPSDMALLAEHLADFHQRAPLVETAQTAHGLWLDFADVLKVEQLTHDLLGADAALALRSSVSYAGDLLHVLSDRIKERHEMGFTRDVHGDLHTRNIFLLPDPVLFDCLEFNDHLRQIDLLNEIAFLGMDLESVGRADLWEDFLLKYQRKLPVLFEPNDKILLKFYMAYRANVRFKVAALRIIQDLNVLNINELSRNFKHMMRYIEMDKESKYEN